MPQTIDKSLDIPDPSEWLSTPLKELASVDSILRCQVCKEFYTTPMMTPCEHTFCSLCIRRSYSADSKCPACRASGQTTHLRRNAVVEELVEAFQKARPAALGFARAITSTAAAAPSKRKTDAIEEADDRPCKRTRSSSKRTEAAEGAQIAEDEDDDEYQASEPSTRPLKANVTQQRMPDMIECPACQSFVASAEINAHLDNKCMPLPKPSSTLRPQVLKRPEAASKPSKLLPLPFPTYSGMKEIALRRKLTDLHLPAWGSKLEMQKRHTEWILLWNANCDAKNPRSFRDLVADLREWEKTQGSQAPRASAIGLAIKDDAFVQSSWAADHKDDFADLIQKARGGRTIPGASTATTAGPPTQNTSRTIQDPSLCEQQAVDLAPNTPPRDPVENLLPVDRPPNTTEREGVQASCPTSHPPHSFSSSSRLLPPDKNCLSRDGVPEAMKPMTVDDGRR